MQTRSALHGCMNALIAHVFPKRIRLIRAKETAKQVRQRTDAVELEGENKVADCSPLDKGFL
jgi:hypothetical protein